MAEKIRIGMIGTGRIARRFFSEAQTVEEAEISKIYNRRMAGALDFADRLGLDAGLCTDSLHTLLDTVDAVYIATPHETHCAYAKEALQRGKHVLCEKPLTLSGKEAVELFALARLNGVVLMEAVKTAYCPGFQAILRLAESGGIGEIREVEACFTRLTPMGMRETEDLEFGGSFTELGTYSLLPAVKLLGTEEQEVTFWFQPMENGLDGYTRAYFRYDGRWAMAKTGLSVKSEGQLLISGTKGYLLAESPWWQTRHFSVCFEDPSKRREYKFPFEQDGLRYELAEFAGRIRTGQENVRGVTAGESIWLAEKMELFLRERKGRRR